MAHGGLPTAADEAEQPEERPVTLEELLDKDEEWLRNRQRAEGTIYLSRPAMRNFIKVVGETPPGRPTCPDPAGHSAASRRLGDEAVRGGEGATTTIPTQIHRYTHPKIGGLQRPT